MGVGGKASKKKKGVDFTSPKSLAGQAVKIIGAPQRAVERAVVGPARELSQALDPGRWITATGNKPHASLSEALGLSGSEPATFKSLMEGTNAFGKPGTADQVSNWGQVFRLGVELTGSIATDPLMGAGKIGQGMKVGSEVAKAVEAGIATDRVAQNVRTAGAITSLLESAGFTGGRAWTGGKDAALRATTLLGDTEKASRIGAEALLHTGAAMTEEAKQVLGYSSRLTFGAGIGHDVIGIPGTEKVGALISKAMDPVKYGILSRVGARNLEVARILAEKGPDAKLPREIGRSYPSLLGAALDEKAHPGAVVEILTALHVDRAGKAAENELASAVAAAFTKEVSPGSGKALRDAYDLTKYRQSLARLSDGGASLLADPTHPLAKGVGEAWATIQKALTDAKVDPEMIGKLSERWTKNLTEWTTKAGGKDVPDVFEQIAAMTRGASDVMKATRMGDEIAARASASGVISYANAKELQAQLAKLNIEDKALKKTLAEAISEAEKPLKPGEHVAKRQLRLIEATRTRIDDVSATIDGIPWATATGAKPFTPTEAAVMGKLFGPDAAKLATPLVGVDHAGLLDDLAATAERSDELASQLSVAQQVARDAAETGQRLRDQAARALLDAETQVLPFKDGSTKVVEKLFAKANTRLGKTEIAAQTWDDALKAVGKDLPDVVEVAPVVGRAAKAASPLVADVAPKVTAHLPIDRLVTELGKVKAPEDLLKVLSRTTEAQTNPAVEQTLRELFAKVAADPTQTKTGITDAQKALRQLAKSVREAATPAADAAVAQTAAREVTAVAAADAAKPLIEALTKADPRLGQFAERFVAREVKATGVVPDKASILDALTQHGETLAARVAKPRVRARAAEMGAYLAGGEKAGAEAVATRKLYASVVKGTTKLENSTRSEAMLLLLRQRDEMAMAAQVSSQITAYHAGVAELKAVVDGLVPASQEKVAAALAELRDTATAAATQAQMAVAAQRVQILKQVNEMGIPWETLPDATPDWLKAWTQMDGHAMASYKAIGGEDFAAFMTNKRMAAYLSNGKTLPTEFGAVTKVWRAWAILRPGFSNRNFIGAFVNNLQFGVKLKDYRSVAEIVALVKQGKEIPEWAKTAEIDRALSLVSRSSKLSDLTGQAFGGHLETFAGATGELFDQKSIVKKIALGGVGKPGAFRVGSAVNDMNKVEENVRLALFWRARQEGLSFDRAMERVYAVHFDYTDLSQFDRNVRKFIPFWTYRSRNLPLQAQLFVHSPVLSRSLMMQRENLRADGQDHSALPPWLTGLALPWGNTVLDLNNYFPSGDVISLADQFTRVRSDPRVAATTAAGFVGGPAVSLAEMVFNRSLYTGQDIAKPTDSEGNSRGLGARLGDYGLYALGKTGLVGDVSLNVPSVLAPLFPGGAPATQTIGGVAQKIAGVVPKVKTYKPR